MRLHAVGLTRSYGGRVALAPTDLDVGSGAGLALLGPNGAGKSTLLALCAGLRLPSAGRVTLDGLPARDPLARRGVGVVLDRAALPARRTLGSLLAARGAGSAEAVLDGLGLGGLVDRPAGMLSAGERQRACLALALVGDPRLLLLDEPLTALDADGVERVVALIAARRRAGCTVVLATHRPDAWLDALTDAVTLSGGVVGPQGSLAQAVRGASREGWILAEGRLARVDAGELLAVRTSWGPPPPGPPAAPVARSGWGARVGHAMRDAASDGVIGVVPGALVLLALGLPLARAASMGAPTRASLDLTLWWAWFVACGLAMWLGARAVAGPLHDRTAIWELAGPRRAGWWGLERVGAAGLVGLIAWAALLGGGLALHGHVPPGLPALAALGAAEIVLLTALSGALGTIYPTLGALAVVGGLWLVGHLGGAWLDVLAVDGRDGVGRLALALLPDLDLLDVHGAVLAGEVPGLDRVGPALVWAAAWTGVGGAGTYAVLERRDLA